MSIAAAPPAQIEFISAAESFRRYPGLKSRVRLYRLATDGSVRVALLPGKPPRYSARDLDRLVDEGIISAGVGEC
jgi:hypothetical protein